MSPHTSGVSHSRDIRSHYPRTYFPFFDFGHDQARPLSEGSIDSGNVAIVEKPGPPRFVAPSSDDRRP